MVSWDAVVSRSSLINDAKSWRPKSDDSLGADKLRLIRYLLKRCAGYNNAKSIGEILTRIKLNRRFSREQFQHQILVPLRSEGKVFIGTSTRGIFLIRDAYDAEITMDFYTRRIRKESRHLRNLQAIAKRRKLFHEHTSKAHEKHPTTLVYLDESGTPSLNDQTPYFIVSAVLIEDAKELRTLKTRFDFLRSRYRLPPSYEFKSVKLNKTRYRTVLNELAPVNYEWAAVCLKKKQLKSIALKQPKALYKYSYKLLIEEILTRVWNAHFYFDEYGGQDSQGEFFRYIRSANSGFPKERLASLDSLDSNKEPFIQLADLIAGAVKNSIKKNTGLIPLIEDKRLFLHHWPPD